jgi:hypothetical protein
VAPFLGTRGRLHSAAASLLVIRAAEFLEWQNPTARASEILSFPALGPRKAITNHEASLSPH